MYKHKFTIKDVAKEVGITAQTVSNYLNKSAPVSEKTKKKIQEAIKKLNYTPNIFARGLRVGKSRIIAVIIPEIAHPFFSAVVYGIEEVTKKEGYTIVLTSSGYDNNVVEYELEKLSNYVDGIIICTNVLERRTIIRILKKKVPIVAVDAKIENGLIPSVEVDNYKAVKEGIQYLVDMGHNNIYYFSEPLSLDTTIDRLNAYQDCLLANNIKLDKNKIIIDKELEINKTQRGYEIMKERLEKIKMPAAVFATSDLIIIGAMKAVIEKGYKIPDDVSFLGYENIFLSEFTNPPLTTIKHPKKNIGRTAAKLLLQLISGKRIKEKRVFLDTVLIKRFTVKSFKD